MSDARTGALARKPKYLEEAVLSNGAAAGFADLDGENVLANASRPARPRWVRSFEALGSIPGLTDKSFDVVGISSSDQTTVADVQTLKKLAVHDFIQEGFSTSGDLLRLDASLLAKHALSLFNPDSTALYDCALLLSGNIFGKDAIDRCLELLTRWRPRLKRSTFDALEWQVAVILDRDEIADAGIHPDPESFEESLSYLSRHLEFRPPSLSLRRNGVFAFSWRPEGRARLNIEFLGNCGVRVICVDARPNQQNPVKGTVELPIANLDGFLAATKCDSWMK